MYEDKTIALDSSFVAPAYIVDNYRIKEASGLVASQLYLNCLWTHNDSRNPSKIYLLSEKGQLLRQYTLKDALFEDTEDIAIQTSRDGQSYIFLGDIGDNQNRRNVKQIYYFPEPVSSDTNLTPKGLISDTLVRYQTIKFTYPNGQWDAETLMFDNLANELYVVTKEQKRAQIFRIPLNQPNKTLTAEKLGEIPYPFLTAGDMSQDGKEILLKNYRTIYYWKRTPNQSLIQTLLQKPSKLPYLYEPQGEAIAWAYNSSGYFTLSENPKGGKAILYFFERKYTQK